DRVRPVGGARAEHALDGIPRIAAGPGTEHAAVGLVQPGEHDHVGARLQVAKSFANLLMEHERRLGRSFVALDRRRLTGAQGRFADFIRGTNGHDPGADEEQPTVSIEDEQWAANEEVLPRFPLVRHGYHCAAVDEYVTELEQELAEVDRELAELRAHTAPRDEVTDQIKRIGEQTSAVLIAANEQREEILRAAKEEADRRVAEA